MGGLVRRAALSRIMTGGLNDTLTAGNRPARMT